MIAIICYFFPAILSIGLFEKLSKKALSFKGWIYRFCFNSIAINFLCFAVKRFLLHTDGLAMLTNGDMIPSVAFNYILMAVPIGIVSAVLQALISDKVKLSVEDNKNEKE